MPPFPARAPNPMYCAYCGHPWDSGLFFGVKVYARPPEQNKVPLLACHPCQATRSVPDMQAQFDAAIGQVPAPVEHPDG